MNELTLTIVNTGKGYEERRRIGRLRLATTRLVSWGHVVRAAAVEYRRDFPESEHDVSSMRAMLQAIGELDEYYTARAAED